MEVVNKTREMVLSGNATYAKTFFQRLRGLMFSKKKRDIVMVLPCESEVKAAIHMHFMNYPIDVLWLDGSKTVVDAKANIRPTTILKPWTVHKPAKPARYIVELGEGKIGPTQTGDEIEFV